MKTILLVDDEQRMRALVAGFLAKEGYNVLEAADGGEAIEVLEHNKVDLIVLDVLMPRVDGWEVCEYVRDTSEMPVVMLTAKDTEHDELHGFRVGADEYVRKPFSPSVLIARINAILRRTNGGETLSVDDVTIDDAARSVVIAGEKIDLTQKEYDLFAHLVRHRGRVISRDNLLNQIWGYDYLGTPRTVDTNINRLRVKLGSAGDRIKTVRGFGYKFE